MNAKLRSAFQSPAFYANIAVLSLLLALACVGLGEVSSRVPRSLHTFIGFVMLAMLPVIVAGFLAIPIGIIFLVRRWSTLDARSRRNLVWKFSLSVLCLIGFILPAL